MDTLPHELHVFIGSFLDNDNLDKYIKALNLKFTNIDYLQLMTYNFPTFTCQNIKNYDIRDIYINILSESIKTNEFNIHVESINKDINTRFRLYFNYRSINYSSLYNFLKYIMMNDFIEFNKYFIYNQDDVTLFKKFQDRMNTRYDDMMILSSNCINIFKYLLNENNDFLYEDVEEVFINEGVTLAMFKLLNKKYKYDHIQLLHLLLLSGNPDIITYILSISNYKFERDEINQIFLYHIKNHKMPRNSRILYFISIYEKFEHILTDEIIKKLYKKVKCFVPDNPYQHDNIPRIPIIQLFEKLSNHPATAKMEPLGKFDYHRYEFYTTYPNQKNIWFTDNRNENE